MKLFSKKTEIEIYIYLIKSFNKKIKFKRSILKNYRNINLSKADFCLFNY